jgi:hypothetical protein
MPCEATVEMGYHTKSPFWMEVATLKDLLIWQGATMQRDERHDEANSRVGAMSSSAADERSAVSGSGSSEVPVPSTSSAPADSDKPRELSRKATSARQRRRRELIMGIRKNETKVPVHRSLAMLIDQVKNLAGRNIRVGCVKFPPYEPECGANPENYVWPPPEHLGYLSWRTQEAHWRSAVKTMDALLCRIFPECQLLNGMSKMDRDGKISMIWGGGSVVPDVPSGLTAAVWYHRIAAIFAFHQLLMDWPCKDLAKPPASHDMNDTTFLKFEKNVWKNFAQVFLDVVKRPPPFLLTPQQYDFPIF